LCLYVCAIANVYVQPNFPINMKIIIALFSCMMFVFSAPFEKQNKTNSPSDNAESEAKDMATANKQSSTRAPRLVVRRDLPFGGGVNLVFRSADGGQTWQDISEGLPDNLQRDGFIVNEDGLYLCAGNGIYHSMPNFTTPFWKKEIFPDKHTSLAPGKHGIFAYNNDGQFLQRINGTSAWSPVYSSFQEKQVRTIFESDRGTVFVGTDKGLFKSINSGETWKQVYARGWGMKIVELNGVLMATSQEGIIRSTDNGENWELVISEGGVGISVEVINGGFAAITYNTMLKTRRVRTSYDGGKTWQPIDYNLPADASIASIVQVGDNFFCGHPAGIFRSSDNGKTWKLLFHSVENKVFNLSVSGNVIYAIPKNGGC